MLIYRIEHPDDGLGPYRSKHSNSDKLLNMIEKRNRSSRHPHMGDDDYDIRDKGQVSKNLQYRCGFKDFDSLKRWFRDYRKEMTLQGFMMFIYEVKENEVWISNKSGQVVFIKDLSSVFEKKKIP